MLLYENSYTLFTLEKNFLNRNFYLKYYIRSFLLKEDKKQDIFTVVDNNCNFYTANFNRKYFKFNALKKINKKIGYSICLNNFIYKKKNPKYNFNYLCYNSLFPNYLEIFLKKLKSLQSPFKTLILIKPVKGGVLSFFNGITGFFPRKHIMYLIKKKSRNYFNLMSDTKQLLIRKSHTFLYYKIKIKARRKYYNAVSKRKKKRKKNKKYRSKIKLIFLSFFKKYNKK